MRRGAALPPAKKGSSLAMAGKIFVVFVLFSGALGFGALGACFMLIGGVSSGSTASDVNSGALTMLGLAVLLAVLGAKRQVGNGVLRYELKFEQVTP